MSARILITGGLGYIGGRLALHMRDAGFDARIGTRRGVGRRPPWAQAFPVSVIDLGDEATLRAACKHVDTVIHLAALNEQACGADPVAALEVNGVGTSRLIRAAERAGVTRFVYMSTAHVYGPLTGKIDEQTVPRPTHPYATSHRAAEECVLGVRNRGVLDGVVLRLSNGFGAPADPAVDRWTLLTNDLCRQAVTEGTLNLVTPGNQLRDFVTLVDATRAVEHMLRCVDWKDGVFNVGGELSISIYDMAKRIASICGERLGFVPDVRRPLASPLSKVEPLDYRVDKLKDSGFRLTAPVEQELIATLELCLKHFHP